MTLMSRRKSNWQLVPGLLGTSLALGLALSGSAFAQNEPAFKIDTQTFKFSDIQKEDQAGFYELDKKKYDIVERIAREKYLDSFWQAKAKETGKSVPDAQKEYETKNLKVTEAEVKSTLEEFKDHPQLKKLTDPEREQQVRDYLRERSRREMIDGIVDSGIQSGKLKIVFPKPEEPVYEVKVTKDDHVRYGPAMSDTKPMGCEGDACLVTIVEYSEFQCPFCNKTLPAAKEVLTTYKGKVRWIVRDFPLSFHDRARPAAVAAKCASEQGKFWEMYDTLFANQGSLGDEDLKGYAKKIQIDTAKFDACYKNPTAANELIERNFQSGMALGVSGTPAFFINGRRLSGALPFQEFDRVIKEELTKKKAGH